MTFSHTQGYRNSCCLIGPVLHSISGLWYYILLVVFGNNVSILHHCWVTY